MEKGYIIIQLVFAISFLIVGMKRFVFERKQNVNDLDKSSLKSFFYEDSALLALVAVSILESVIYSLIISGDANHIAGYNILVNSVGIWSIFELIKFSRKGLVSIILQIALLSIINIMSLL